MDVQQIVALAYREGVRTTEIVVLVVVNKWWFLIGYLTSMKPPHPIGLMV